MPDLKYRLAWRTWTPRPWATETVPGRPACTYSSDSDAAAAAARAPGSDLKCIVGLGSQERAGQPDISAFGGRT